VKFKAIKNAGYTTGENFFASAMFSRMAITGL